MSVLSYLEDRASRAVLSQAEENSIAVSISTIKSRLISHFGDALVQQFRFGSSSRGTILPRKMDEQSDIDYMVVLKDDGSNPQTYLDRVRRFAEKYYANSEIKQSSPTIVLELNHIKFDLVPAIKTSWAYKIVGSTSAWQDTNPNDFNDKLSSKNSSELFKIKPTIRLAKFWNARNGYVYDSFSLEKWIVDLWFGLCVNQTQYLFNVFDNLRPEDEATQWRRERIERAKAIVAKVRELERDQLPYSAESEVKKLIPE